jgi:hypothetical protein
MLYLVRLVIDPDADFSSTQPDEMVYEQSGPEAWLLVVVFVTVILLAMFVKTDQDRREDQKKKDME